MKKLFATLSIVAAAFAANAQEGMPVKGDYALGINATPFLTYMGGLFSNAGSTAPVFSSKDGGLTLSGKYFTADNKAMRAALTLGTFNTTTETPTGTTTNTTKTSSYAVGINVGMEYRRMKGRVVGSYGPMIGFNVNNGAGNTEFTNGADGTLNTKTSGGNAFNLSLGGFVGVEYFFAKYISIGGELGLGLNYNTTSEKKKSFSNGNPEEVNPGKSSAFSIANTTTSGVNLTFYF